VSGLISKPFATWKKNNPTKVLDNNSFYSIEVYNYSAGKSFDFGDKKVNYFENGMINFEFKYDAQKTMNLYSQSTRYSKRS
jgi:alpha-amylase